MKLQFVKHPSEGVKFGASGQPAVILKILEGLKANPVNSKVVADKLDQHPEFISRQGGLRVLRYYVPKMREAGLISVVKDEKPVSHKISGSPMSRYRSQIREVINRNTVVSLALAQGFNVFLPVYDGGVDFIFYRESDGLLHKVQLKSRWTIDRKYIDRDIWMAFPVAGDWYLMPHDKMLATAEADGRTTKTTSWIEDGNYSRKTPSAAAVAACAQYRFAEISEVAASAAEDEST